MKIKFLSVLVLLALVFSALTPIMAEAKAETRVSSSPLNIITGCSWTGSVDANWSTPGNWGSGCSGAGGIPGTGDTLTFPLGASNTTMTDDLPAITLQGLSFPDAQDYTLNGANAISLTGGIDVLGGNQTINAPLTVAGAGVTFHAANGTNLAIGGTLNLGTYDVSFTVDTVSGVIGLQLLGAIHGSGAAKISKYGTGELQIKGGDHSSDVFDIDINAGSISTNPSSGTWLPFYKTITLASGTDLYLKNSGGIGSIAGSGNIHASSFFQIRQGSNTTFTGDIFGTQQMGVIGNGSSVLTIDRSGGSLSYAGEINSNAGGKIKLVNTTATSVPQFLASSGSLELNNSQVGAVQVGFSSGGFNYNGSLILSGTTANTASSITVLNNSSITSVINSATDYGRVNVTSPVDLGAGAPTFALQGSYTPTSGDVFTIIQNTNSGTATQSNAAFSNLPQGDSLPFNSFNMMADYQAAGNTAFTISATTPDVTPPTVQSIIRTSPNPNSSASVVFLVTFSENVTGVDLNDFEPFTSGISGAYASYLNKISDSVYSIQVQTGTGNGTLRLDVPSTATINDTAGNPLGGLPYTGGETYTVEKDLVAPTVSSITRAGTDPTNATTVDFTVTFSENVTGVDINDFTLTMIDVAGATLSGVSGSDATYTVTVNTGTGNGTLGLNLTDDDSIIDGYGNALGGTGAGNGNFTGEVYSVAKTAPALLSPANGANLPVVRPSFDWSNFTGATAYQIQVSKNPSFPSTQLTLNKTVSVSNYAHTGNLSGNTLYYWRVRAKVGGLWKSWSNVWSFTTGNPPSVPVLSTPTNGALAAGPSPLFNWSDSSVPAGAVFDHYQIQIATDNAFTNIIHDLNLAGASNSQDNTAVLNSATTYYWRVRSFAVNGDYSAWSATWSVKIKYPATTLLNPADLSLVGSLRPTFTWTAVSGATGYNIQISKSLTFGLGTIKANVTSLTYTPGSNLSAHTKYYWRVRVTGPYGPSDWSVVFSFTTP